MNKYLLLLIMIFIPSITNAKENFTVKNVYIEGLYRIPKSIIISKIPFYKMEDCLINLENISDLIKSIFSTKYFSKIKIILDEKNDLIIKLEENPIITSINFKGNKILKNKFLEEFFESKNFLVKEPLNEINLFYIKNKLIDLYENQGNFNTSIEIHNNLYSLNRVKVNFIFKEGSFSKIEEIKIIGNNVFSSNKLLKMLKSYNSGLFYIKSFIKPIYKKEDLIKDLINMEKFYKKNGYLNFKIKENKINFSDDKSKVFIELVLLEGKKYIINENEIIGDFDNEYFYEIKEITSKYFYKNIFQFDKIEDLKNELNKFLLKKGYSYPTIHIKTLTSNDSNFSKLQLNIISGPKCYVRNINIEGNKKTSDKIIRREINQIEFSPLNPSEILEDVKRLNKLKYFKSINIKSKSINKHQIDLIYNVEEIPFSGFKVGANLGSKLNLNFNCSIIQDNLLGTGSVIEFKSNYNNKDINTEIIVNDPYFFENKKIKIGSKCFYYHSKKNDKNKFDLLNNNYGLSGIINIPLDENLWINFEMILNKNNLKLFYIDEFIFYDLDCLNDLKNIIFYTTDRNKRINPILTKSEDYIIFSSLNFNDLDHLIFPTKGMHFKIVNKFTLPKVSDSNFFLTILSLDNYLTCNKLINFTFLNKIQFYFMNTLYKKNIPHYNCFFSDKVDLVRGYSEKLDNFNFDYDKFFYEDSEKSLLNNTKLIVKNELSLPTNLLGDRYENLFRISYFLDYGLGSKSKKRVENVIDMFNFKYFESILNYYMSTGLNVKILSPIGPIGFSYNLPLNGINNEVIERFQLNISNKW